MILTQKFKNLYDKINFYLIFLTKECRKLNLLFIDAEYKVMLMKKSLDVNNLSKYFEKLLTRKKLQISSLFFFLYVFKFCRFL